VTRETLPDDPGPRNRVLVLSTLAFTLMFNVWLMLGVLGVPIKRSMGLSDVQMEWLLAAAILSGALFRLNFGIWADRFGGKRVMVGLLFATAIPAYLFAFATTYPQLIACALLFGLAGNSFSAGIAWNSAWFGDASKGTALGIFGAGNVGAAGTKLLVVLVPSVLTLVPASGLLGGMIPGGWRTIPAIYAIMLFAFGVLILVMAPSPDRKPGRGRPMAEMLAPLRSIRVWRFSLYYVVFFGAYVALSSWLPKFYMDTYGLTLKSAALLTATFILPASLLRPLGGFLSDRFGPRVVTYSVFLVMTIALAILAVPNRMAAGQFAAMLFIVGCGMGIGKASVYKYIPNFFPSDVGAVGGLVGMLGALGGFVLPPLFGWIGRATGSPQSAFVALLVPTVASLAWLHAAVLAANAKERGPRVNAAAQAIHRASTEAVS
jgi:MFS transporter, NNP family, nitrate/nitrite transporter